MDTSKNIKPSLRAITSIDEIKHGQEVMCIKTVSDHDSYREEDIVQFREGIRYVLRIADDLDVYTLNDQNEQYWLITRDEEDEDHTIKEFNEYFALTDKIHTLYPTDWDDISDNTDRIETPKGWIVRTMTQHGVHQVFIEDINKEWILE